MVQLCAYINLTVYEKAPKKSIYRPLSVGGKQCRRIAVIGVSTLASLCKRLLANVCQDAVYDFKAFESDCSMPEDAVEFCVEDVARTALGYVKGEVWRAPVVNVASNSLITLPFNSSVCDHTPRCPTLYVLIRQTLSFVKALPFIYAYVFAGD
jgi:hypothetical protein